MWGHEDGGRTSFEMFIAIYQSIRRHIQDVFNFEIQVGDIVLQLECRYVCRALRPKNHVWLSDNVSRHGIILIYCPLKLSG